MNNLDELPFETALGSLVEPMEAVTAPDIHIPDYLQILRDTEYEFTLENWVLTGLQHGYCRDAWPVYQESPSCPPYWLMFTSPLEVRRASSSSSSHPPRRRHSLGSVGDQAWAGRPQHRSVRLLISSSEVAAGYSEDEEVYSSSSSAAATADEEARCRPRSRGGESLGGGHKGAEPRQASPATSPRCHRRHNKSSRKPSLKSRPGSPSQSRPGSPSQPRPYSAGPAGRNRRQKVLRWDSHGIFLDSSAELPSALTLSQEERELLEAVIEQGYPLRTAIQALQKTGYRSPEKILTYLVARERLCASGYDEAQVEEALEMFQCCESKAAVFLRLLTQFKEMGFQQNAIKEVLLVHENNRDRALEELMTPMTE